jgi:hypothetical protein
VSRRHIGTHLRADEKRFAFQNTCDGHEEIYIMNADGQGIFNTVPSWRARPLP